MGKLTAYEIDELKRGFDLAGRIGADGVQLRREGPGWRGACPWCGGSRNPPFTVTGRPAWFYCHRCGERGDAIDYFRRYHELDFREAIEAIGGDRAVDVSIEAIEARRNEERAREGDRLRKIEEKREAARKLWARCVPLEGTLAERYLIARGNGLFEPPFPASLRFCGKLKCSWIEEVAGDDGELVEKKRTKIGPALVALVQASDRSVATVHRIWIEERDDGTVGKATWCPADAVKQLYGSPLDGAIRLGPLARHLILAEGVETGEAVRQALAGRPGVSVWSTISSGQMLKLAFGSERPEAVTIMADHDRPVWNRDLDREIPPAGQTKAAAACERFRKMGIAAAWCCPSEPGDWLDVLIGEVRA